VVCGAGRSRSKQQKAVASAVPRSRSARHTSLQLRSRVRKTCTHDCVYLDIYQAPLNRRTYVHGWGPRFLFFLSSFFPLSFFFLCFLFPFPLSFLFPFLFFSRSSGPPVPRPRDTHIWHPLSQTPLPKEPLLHITCKPAPSRLDCGVCEEWANNGSCSQSMPDTRCIHGSDATAEWCRSRSTLDTHLSMQWASTVVLGRESQFWLRKPRLCAHRIHRAVSTFFLLRALSAVVGRDGSGLEQSLVRRRCAMASWISSTSRDPQSEEGRKNTHPPCEELREEREPRS